MDTEVVVALLALVSAIGVEIVRNVRAQRRTDAQLAQVVEQMQPNGGSSVADRVEQINDRVERIDHRVEAVQRNQSAYGERLAAVESFTTYVRDRI